MPDIQPKKAVADAAQNAESTTAPVTATAAVSQAVVDAAQNADHKAESALAGIESVLGELKRKLEVSEEHFVGELKVVYAKLKAIL
ncbi:MAG: hypothetical protein ACYC0M_15740 [Burkholderiales bacterium]